MPILDSTIFHCMLRILQGVVMDIIDGNDFCACIYIQVKQMLIGEPFSPVSITAGAETIEIERDCAVPAGKEPMRYRYGML